MDEWNEVPENGGPQDSSGSMDSDIRQDVQQDSSNAETCPVVGIGASAGGLEAVGELLEALPVDTGMAFVFIQHLDPNHASALVGLLQNRTPLQVVEVTDGAGIRRNVVYVIPPNTVMTMARGVLRLTPRPAFGEKYMPIDVFLHALAEDQKS